MQQDLSTLVKCKRRILQHLVKCNRILVVYVHYVHGTKLTEEKIHKVWKLKLCIAVPSE